MAGVWASPYPRVIASLVVEEEEEEEEEKQPTETVEGEQEPEQGEKEGRDHECWPLGGAAEKQTHRQTTAEEGAIELDTDKEPAQDPGRHDRAEEGRRGLHENSYGRYSVQSRTLGVLAM
ncbi:hypothetical protein O9K51_06246 [Purpureocillium lavendulum]|uniref:Uncharacterized protein n=1 Tax=Purpureocillium lavendulum TaxID=1247861 RepID=A0AB34FQ14_9HYPO|nr:hypothetical protein O9K51_06246 [Purpureocillium lavendulum]